jgi:predicted nucleic acid-binding protein
VLIVDASALLRALIPDGGEALAARLGGERELHAPHLIDLEIASALRRLCGAGALGDDRARDAITDLHDLNVRRYPHDPLLPRIWELRDNLTAYDAAYVALAETLEAPLLTADRRLAASPGHEAEIELIPV